MHILGIDPGFATIGFGLVDENTLTVNVGRLRRKLEAAGLPDLIRTRKGTGYLVEG